MINISKRSNEWLFEVLYPAKNNQTLSAYFDGKITIDALAKNQPNKQLLLADND
jgi:hypothetical protein